MSRVLAYAVRRKDGKPFPIHPNHFHASELSPDGTLFYCVDKDDALNCVGYPVDSYGDVELVRGWTSITDWSVTA